MQAEIRKKTIINLISERGSLSVKDIVQRFNIAEITARRDLDELSSRGLIIRTHGGAIKSQASDLFFGRIKRGEIHKEAKEKICRYAVSLINENDVIYMDCGSTVYRLAKNISHLKNLRVLTNSLLIVNELIKFPNIKINLIGGELDNERLALYGPVTENLLLRYKADKAFIGAGGVSLINGLSSNEEKEASITLKMAESASEVILLADASKFEKNSYYSYAPITLADKIITDKNISKEILDLYINNKVEVVAV